MVVIYQGSLLFLLLCTLHKLPLKEVDSLCPPTSVNKLDSANKYPPVSSEEVGQTKTTPRLAYNALPNSTT